MQRPFHFRASLLPAQSRSPCCVRSIRCHASTAPSGCNNSQVSRKTAILRFFAIPLWITVGQGSAEAVQIGEGGRSYTRYDITDAVHAVFMQARNYNQELSFASNRFSGFKCVTTLIHEEWWSYNIPNILLRVSTIYSLRTSIATTCCTADAYRKSGAIKRVVRLFMQEEFRKLEAITSTDAFVYFQSPEKLPYAGKYTGYDCVRQFMDRFNESFIIISVPEVYQYINESGSVFAAFDFILKAVRNGREIRTSMTMKLKVNDELQLTKVAIISDTLAQYEALQG